MVVTKDYWVIEPLVYQDHTNRLQASHVKLSRWAYHYDCQCLYCSKQVLVAYSNYNCDCHGNMCKHIHGFILYIQFLDVGGCTQRTRQAGRRSWTDQQKDVILYHIWIIFFGRLISSVNETPIVACSRGQCDWWYYRIPSGDITKPASINSPNKSKMKLQKWPSNPMGKYLNIFLAQHRRDSTLKLLRI